MLRTFHSWLVCEKGGDWRGELLSGMQGLSPQGATAKGTRAHPGQKALGRSQSVGGLSGQVPVQAHCTQRTSTHTHSDLEGYQGRTAKKGNTRKEQKRRRDDGKEEDAGNTTHARTNARTNSGINRRSFCTLALTPSPVPPGLLLIESKCLEEEELRV